MDPVTIYSAAMVARVMAPIIYDGWKKMSGAEKKEEQKRVKKLEDEKNLKLELQRESHKQRLEEAMLAHEKSMEAWKTKIYDERCWPLRNPFEMQICEPISNDTDYFGENPIVPCRVISALKDNSHPYARTINGNLSSFIVNYYPTNSFHAVVSEIGAWKDNIPSNDASINYLYAGLKKQPVMVLCPTIINDGKTFIFKVWSWGLGENINYPAGFEFGRLELPPLYKKTVYEETLSMIELAKEMDYAPSKFFSPKLQHNISVIKEVQGNGLTGKMKEKMLSFLGGAPEIDDVVKARMEEQISGIFCCVTGMYADAYHLLEYKTLPKLPSLLPHIPGIEYMLPSLRDYYYELLNKMELLESDKLLVSRIYLDVADAFSKLDFSFSRREEIIEPFTTRALGLYLKNEKEEEKDEILDSIPLIQHVFNSNPELKKSEFVADANQILERAKLKPIC